MRGTRQLASRLSISFPTAAQLAAVVGLVSSCWLLGSIVGCSSRGSDAVSVAQVAVRANPDLELVATDERQAVLTVRVKRTGQILTVRADDVVAGNAFRNLDTNAGTSGQPRATAPAAPLTTATASASGAAAQVEVSTPGARVSVGQPSGENKNSPASAPVQSTTRTAVTAETPADRISAARARLRDAVATGATPADGVSPSTPSTPAGASIDESLLKRRPNPVQCKGTDTVRLDGVLLRADKTAIQAMGQCGVHITNSHIVGRVAIQVLGNATVTIENLASSKARWQSKRPKAA